MDNRSQFAIIVRRQKYELLTYMFMVSLKYMGTLFET